MLDDGLPQGRDRIGDEPDEFAAGFEEEESGEAFSEGSLSDDIVALIDDGKTYVEAELAYQKTRLAFAAGRGKSGALYGICAFAVLHLALVGLVIGAIIALTPVITAWGATALVVGLLLIAGVILALKAKQRFARLVEAYAETKAVTGAEE